MEHTQNDMLRHFGTVVLFATRQAISWVAISLLLVGAYVVYFQVSYQPVMTTGDWLFVIMTAAGICINAGMYLSQFKRQREINKRLEDMRDEWTEYKGEMRGEARGRKDQFTDMMVWLDEQVDRRVEERMKHK